MVIESSKMGRKKGKKQQQQLQQEEFARPTRSTSKKKRERTDSETSNEVTVDKGPASRMAREARAVLFKGKKKKSKYDPEEEAR